MTEQISDAPFTRGCIRNPTLVMVGGDQNTELEYSVHLVPRSLLSEIRHVFPGVDIGAGSTRAQIAAATLALADDADAALSSSSSSLPPPTTTTSSSLTSDVPSSSTSSSPLLSVVTFQRAVNDLVRWDAPVAAEKDALLESFVAWATPVCEAVKRRGYWAEFIDPCSGLPALGERGTGVYSEVEGIQALCRYSVTQVGVCSVLTHPRYKTHCYPASLFTTAPAAVLFDALDGSIEAKGNGAEIDCEITD
jgi:hypothetical protein